MNLTHAPLSSSLLTYENPDIGTESIPNFPLGTSHVTVNAENHGYNSRGSRYGRGRVGHFQCYICHKLAMMPLCAIKDTTTPFNHRGLC